MADAPVVVLPDRRGELVVTALPLLIEQDPLGLCGAVGATAWTGQVLLVIALGEEKGFAQGNLRGDGSFAGAIQQLLVAIR